MRDAEPGDAVEFEHGGGAISLACDADEPRCRKDAEVRDEDDVSLFFREKDRIRYIARAVSSDVDMRYANAYDRSGSSILGSFSDRRRCTLAGGQWDGLEKANVSLQRYAGNASSCWRTSVNSV